MKISIITPFYKGNKYMENYFKNIKKIKEKNNIEIIIVNDSPEEKIIINEDISELKIKIIENEKNYGIHKARVIGLLHATR